MKLTDLQPLDAWEELENAIQESSGLSVSVFDADGIRITDNMQWVNRLCPEIKAEPKGQSFICATAHMNIANMASKSGDAVVEECDAGLLKLVVPITVNGEFLGAVGACGLRLDGGEVDAFLVNKITGLDEDNVEKLSEGIGAVTAEQAAAIGQDIRRRLMTIVRNHGPGNPAS